MKDQLAMQILGMLHPQDIENLLDKIRIERALRLASKAASTQDVTERQRLCIASALSSSKIRILEQTIVMLAEAVTRATYIHEQWKNGVPFDKREQMPDEQVGQELLLYIVESFRMVREEVQKQAAEKNSPLDNLQRACDHTRSQKSEPPDADRSSKD